jgi:hypothetical protein
MARVISSWRQIRFGHPAGARGGNADELVISTAPVIFGAGKRLFDGLDRDTVRT